MLHSSSDVGKREDIFLLKDDAVFHSHMVVGNFPCLIDGQAQILEWSSGMSANQDWRVQAGYFFVLYLDALSLAWEYLRRNSAYRNAWACPSARPNDDARGWGLRRMEDPDLDSRGACPEWIAPLSILRVTDQPAEVQGARFSLWRLSGRKSLLHDEERLLLTVEDHCRPLRLALSGGVEEGTLLDVVLPVSNAIRNLWPAFLRLMSLLESSAQPAAERSWSDPAVKCWFTCGRYRRLMLRRPAQRTGRLPRRSSARMKCLNVGSRQNI